LAGDNPELKAGMARLYDTFRDAPILGSLIDPARSLKGDLLTADWSHVQPLLSKALSVGEAVGEDLQEAAITAQGLARAAELLGQRYQLVITNVPYLARGKQFDLLKDFCERYYETAKNDLANVFLERCLELASAKGTIQIVMPQNWLFLTSYRKQRESLLKTVSWNLLARLGSGAFDTISGEVVNVILLTQTCAKPAESFRVNGLNASAPRSAADKAELLSGGDLIEVEQRVQLFNPDARITLDDSEGLVLLQKYAAGLQGIASADFPRFGRGFWELSSLGANWSVLQSTVEQTTDFGGREFVLFWQQGNGELARSPAARVQGLAAWGKQGVAVRQMGSLPSTRYSGTAFDTMWQLLFRASLATWPRSGASAHQIVFMGRLGGLITK